jgi:hypothetical protein
VKLPSAIGLLVATALSVLPSGCKRHELEYPDLVERSAVYTIEDGRVVRIEKHGEGLEALTVEERTPLAGLPESLRKPTSVELTLSSYYPILRGDEDGLFPRGFSAAPTAYYVTRTPENIRRDYCEDLRLSYATKKQLPDARAQAECGTYWLEETAQSVEETYCRTRLIRSATRLTGPGPLLRKKCKAYIEAEKAAEKEKATAQAATPEPAAPPKPAAPPAAPLKPPK